MTAGGPGLDGQPRAIVTGAPRLRRALCWPLTGRWAELDFVDRALRRRDGQVGVVVAGAAGVGKTRLAREALVVAARRGAVTRWAIATASARSVPLGALAHLVPTTDVSDPGALVRRASTALLADAPRAGVVIGVDDAHLLDDLSATVVHQLAVRRVAPLVLTLRAGERAPDAVTALWKDGHLDRLELQPLSEAETRELVEAALGGQLETHSARRIWETSQGNALFLRQLVEAALGAATLRAVAGVWQWRGEPTVTPQLGELVDARIGLLPDAVRRVLELLAFGEPLGTQLLAGLAGLTAVEEAERRALVTVAVHRRRVEARLAHPLYGEVLRARTSVGQARNVRGQLATALAGTGGRRSGDLLRRAVLALDSDTPADADLLARAARQATALYDLALGERLARAALEAGAGIEAAVALCYVLSWQSRHTEAAQLLPVLNAAARTPAQRAETAILRAGNLFFVQGRVDDAEHALRVAMAETPCDTLVAMAAMFASLANRTVQAARTAATVLAASPVSDRAVAFAVAALGPSLAVQGRGDEVPETIARHSPAVGRSGETSFFVLSNGWGELLALTLCGRLAEADDAVRRYREVAGSLSLGAGWVALYGAQVALARGDLAAATKLLRDAVCSFDGADPSDWTFTCLVALTQALGMTGDAAAARETLARAEAAYRPSIALLEPDLHLARAWTAAAEGACTEAVASCRRAVAVAAGAGQPAVEVVALHTAVCFGDGSGAGRLRDLAPLVDGPRAPTAAAHATALAGRDGDALEDASTRLEEMGALLLAVDAAAQAAATHHRHGRRGSAHEATARAQRLITEACQGASTPALRVVSRPLPLTTREREIAALVVAGLSNREIAERLVVSVRTVEGHIYRACAKLEVDREGLARLL